MFFLDDFRLPAKTYPRGVGGAIARIGKVAPPSFLVDYGEGEEADTLGITLSWSGSLYEYAINPEAWNIKALHITNCVEATFSEEISMNTWWLEENTNTVTAIAQLSDTPVLTGILEGSGVSYTNNAGRIIIDTGDPSLTVSKISSQGIEYTNGDEIGQFVQLGSNLIIYPNEYSNISAFDNIEIAFSLERLSPYAKAVGLIVPTEQQISSIEIMRQHLEIIYSPFRNRLNIGTFILNRRHRKAIAAVPLWMQVEGLW